MTTIEKPIPDGSLTLHFVNPEVKPKTIPFIEMAGHRPDDGGYVINHADKQGRDFYPYGVLLFISVHYNSDDYTAARKAWEAVAHQNHLSLDDEGQVKWLDDECSLCLKERHEALANQALQSMGLELLPTDEDDNS